MRLKKRHLKNCRLYVIVKADLSRAKKMISAGADIIQLRDKNAADKKLLTIAKELSRFCEEKKVLFIVNDRVDIAMAAQADGVHLGQDDLPVSRARKITPKNFLIGVSTHSLKQAVKAQKEGADYIGFGPIFATKTKPRLKPIGTKELEQVKEKIKIPYFAIGDVTLEKLNLLQTKGVKRTAVHSAIYNSKNPKQKISQFKKKLSI